MPAFETMDLIHIAVLWEKIGTDSHGEATHGEPDEIDCRWVGKPRAVMGSNNEPITVDATAIVEQDIPLLSLMWLGTLNEYYGAGSSGDDVRLMEVVAIPKADDIKGRHTRRSVRLKLYRSQQ